MKRLVVLAVAVVSLSACEQDRVPSVSAAVEAAAPGVVQAASIGAQAPPKTSPRFVVDEVQERLAPTADAPVTNTLSRQQQVDVHEIQGDWARVSAYYDGAAEGATGQVARWVPASGLSVNRPRDLPKPVSADDPRIQGIPSVGDGGLTARDVQILYAASTYYLEKGSAKLIEYGDRSTSRPGTYYLNFGGPKNHFFTAADIPEVEERIRRLAK